jgi:hypothetical protein
VQNVMQGARKPWVIECEEQGCWRLRSGDNRMIGYKKVEAAENAHASALHDAALASPTATETPHERSYEETLQEEACAEVIEAAQEEGVSHGLSIECWSLPVPETELERLDRVMNTFLERLQAAGVVVPVNFQRLRQCGMDQHAKCYVYRFGTRRLHVQVQNQGGRLSIVVRCGGGFLDFATFAQRHGRMEQLKLHPRSDLQGNQTMRFNSVLRGSGFKIKEAERARPKQPPIRPSSRLGAAAA